MTTIEPEMKENLLILAASAILAIAFISCLIAYLAGTMPTIMTGMGS